MKKKIGLLAATSLLVGVAYAHSSSMKDGWKSYDYQQEQVFQQLTPTYLDHVHEYAGWNANWFVSMQGGFSAFVGKPVGHEDFFGRMKPLLHLSVGKWITPKVGLRVAYQGLELLDADIESRSYQNVHADLMYNISSHFWNKDGNLPKWDVIPFVGVGMMHNSYTHKKPFALSCGVLGKYRLADRLHLSAELGWTDTFQDFDGYGKANRFGDNLLHASVGVTASIGKNGWKRVIDPIPYIHQNDILLEYIDRIHELYPEIDKLASSEREKIHKIENQLGNADPKEAGGYRRNDYSGLNSLRERMRRESEWHGYNSGGMNLTDSISGEEEYLYDTTEDKNLSFTEEYLKSIKSGESCVGAPIFFFFRLNSTVLTEKAQIINVEEVAKVMKKYNLIAKITGAADSQTGKAEANTLLSRKRAEYIADLMKKYGVEPERITYKGEGGINTYKPFTANRNTCIMLFAKPNK